MHEASTEHDLSTGLRDNFNPKARWKSAINGAIAIGRMKRAVSGDQRLTPTLSSASNNASKRLESNNDSDEESDADDGASSRGWRTPGAASGSGHLSPFAGMSRKASLAASGEENENVKVHPPLSSNHEHTVESSESPVQAQELKREHEHDHSAAVHKMDDEHLEKSMKAAVEVEDDDDHLQSMPGTFDLGGPSQAPTSGASSQPPSPPVLDTSWSTLFSKLRLGR